MSLVSVKSQKVMQVKRDSGLLHQPAVVSTCRQIGVAPGSVGRNLIQINVHSRTASGSVGAIRSRWRNRQTGNAFLPEPLKNRRPGTGYSTERQRVSPP